MALIDPSPGLRALLLSNSSISALVGGDRIFPDNLKQGEIRDSLVYNLITELETYKMTGPSALVSSRFQWDAWSRSRDSARALADLVKEQLGGFSGRIDVAGLNSPNDFVNVQGIFLIDGRSGYDNEAQLYLMSRDYFVWYGDRND